MQPEPELQERDRWAMDKAAASPAPGWGHPNAKSLRRLPGCQCVPVCPECSPGPGGGAVVTRVGSWRSRPPQEMWILTATPSGPHTGGAGQEKGCSVVSLKMVTPQGQERAWPPSNRRTPGRPWGQAHIMQEPTLGADSGRPQPRPPSQGLCASYHLVQSPPTLDTQPLEPGIPTPHLGWHHPS